jgi:hypothetical protein
VICECGQTRWWWWWWCWLGKTPDLSTRALWQSYQQRHLGVRIFLISIWDKEPGIEPRSPSHSQTLFWLSYPAHTPSSTGCKNNLKMFFTRNRLIYLLEPMLSHTASVYCMPFLRNTQLKAHFSTNLKIVHTPGTRTPGYLRRNLFSQLSYRKLCCWSVNFSVVRVLPWQHTVVKYDGWQSRYSTQPKREKY